MVVSTLATLLISGAQAAPPSTVMGPTVPLAQDDMASGASTTATARSSEKKVQFEVSFRARSMSLPGGILDGFFGNDSAAYPQWALNSGSAYCSDPSNADSVTCGTSRPAVGGMAYGTELLIKANRSAGIIWFDYADANMSAGYWDDLDDPPEPLDGDWLEPATNFGIVMFGADYQFEFPAVRLDMTKNIFGLDIVVGTGLGLGITTGTVARWKPGENDEPGFELRDDGVAPNGEKNVPDFWPILDINLGLRLNFADRVSIRLEGGLHTLLYYGATVGFRF